jgi:phosphatidylserine/phosphatidylglycerophosphate/cardiolipin synthase-like enzyme
MRLNRSYVALALAASLMLPASTALGQPPSVANDPMTACRDADVAPVTTGAVFNNPAAGDPTAVVRQICSLVKQAPASSTIRIAHFVVSGDAGYDFAQELIQAHRRGVTVQMVLDGWQVDNPAAELLLQELGEDRTAASWLHVCSNVSPEGSTSSCLGTKGNHNKFYLFSRTGEAEKVVVQSSANFTNVNSRTYWNNAVTLVGNERLYDAYGEYFSELASESRTSATTGVIRTGMKGGEVDVYISPVADGDPVLEQIDAVKCRAGTTLRVGMSEWDTSRKAIAEQLVRLARSGCEVKVVHGPIDAEIDHVLSLEPRIQVRSLNSGTLPGRIHSKYAVVEGENGRGTGHWVMTGSQNWNHTSLRRNDEATLQIHDPAVVSAYAQAFEAMFAAADM